VAKRRVPHVFRRRDRGHVSDSIPRDIGGWEAEAGTGMVNTELLDRDCGDNTVCEYVVGGTLIFLPFSSGHQSDMIRDSTYVIDADEKCCQAYLFDNDARFFPGFQLDSSWILCTVSWSLMLVCAAAVTIAAFVLPSEGGYELIPNFPNYGYSA
jgi:hypothetical protein